MYNTIVWKGPIRRKRERERQKETQCNYKGEKKEHKINAPHKM